ncbi:ybl63 [Escherichia coli]|uniref:Ybl63 n=1 Tax=Escherichia coli TaxID=562 RepID=A0A376LPI9_ECOLX|nr:ybl63 [Escherichia coli]
MHFVLWLRRYWLVFLPGNWAYGAIAGCTFFIAREHTQAEYRWIEMFGHGKRMNMPWWGGFDPRVWDVASLMDFLCRWWLVCWSGCWLIVGEKGSCKRNTGRGAASGCWE